MATNEPVKIELIPVINNDNELQLQFRDQGKLVFWRSGQGIGDLVPDGEVPSLTLEVNDFFQYGSLYTVYAAVLIPARATVHAYWEATGRGQRWTLAVHPIDVFARRLVIGASPRMPGVPVPAVFRSWQQGDDGLPTDVGTPIGQ
jgi:hypothetical protein